MKPQDVYVVLKLVATGSRRAPYSHLAVELVMSPSEVHASVKGARASGLLHRAPLDDRPSVAALEEFLVHGLKYVFPAERGEMTRPKAALRDASFYELLVFADTLRDGRVRERKLAEAASLHRRLREANAAFKS